MIRTRRLFIFLTLILLFTNSCKTNKTPNWVTDPPADDELNVYIVGVGEGELVYDSVIEQLYTRFNITSTDRLTNLILSMLKDEKNQDISILDRWNNKNIDYILVRIKRSFFDPLLELYSSRYNEMINYQDQNEVIADQFYDDGFIYNAYKYYLKALETMLNQEDEFYSISIINVTKKLKNILSSIQYLDVEKFSVLYVGRPVLQNRLFFRVSESDKDKFDGFLFKIEFQEGWKSKDRTALLHIKNNKLVFVPSKPMVSGNSSISSKLDVSDLISLVNKWKSHPTLGSDLNEFYQEINQIIDNSIIQFEFIRDFDLNSFQKVLSFSNSKITEGIENFFLEQDNVSFVAPVLKEDLTLNQYIREINIITENAYSYMVIEDSILINITSPDISSTVINIVCDFSIVDLQSYKILKKHNITAEYISSNNEYDLIYLDFGAKIAESIYNMKF